MTIKLPPMNTLHTFYVAARNLNFTKTGEDFNISHAAVSNQMKRLEAWFGRKLFRRTGRGLALTPAGLELLRTIEPSLLAISAASENIKLVWDRKNISIACLPSIATRWLVPSLADFMQAHPHLTVELSYAEAFQEFDEEAHDILITHLVKLPERVKTARVFRRTSKPVASPDYVRNRKHTLSDRLEGARLLHDASTQAWEDWFAVAGFHPTRFTHGPVFPDFNLLFTAVLAGHGVALCPVEVFGQEIARGDLIVLSEHSTQTSEAYYMVTAEQTTSTVMTFVKWFKTRVSSLL